jgi:hypothetical protein
MSQRHQWRPRTRTLLATGVTLAILAENSQPVY